MRRAYLIFHTIVFFAAAVLFSYEAVYSAETLIRRILAFLILTWCSLEIRAAIRELKKYNKKNLSAYPGSEIEEYLVDDKGDHGG